MLRHSPIAAGSSDTLDYLQSMLGQLRALAEAERYDMLAYLIDMAYVEASDVARGARPSTIRKNKGDGAT